MALMLSKKKNDGAIIDANVYIVYSNSAPVTNWNKLTYTDGTAFTIPSGTYSQACVIGVAGKNTLAMTDATAFSIAGVKADGSDVTIHTAGATTGNSFNISDYELVLIGSASSATSPVATITIS